MSKFPDATIIYVDLNNHKIKKVIVPSEVYRLYPGGSALAMYLIIKDMNPTVEPFSKESLLAFTVSPLVGLPFSGNSRLVVAAKSPLTDTIGDSQSGGDFPAQLKNNGYDGIVFTGISKSPVYLYIDDSHISIKDAKHLWGKELSTADVSDVIKEELGQTNLEIAQIGTAGENRVLYSCILNQNNRANGRNGMGAVMGSKNLKAVVLKGGKQRQPHDQEAFTKFIKNTKTMIKNNPGVEGLGKYGTAGDTEGFSELGFLPTNNWQTGTFTEGASKITGTTMYDTVLKSRDTCYACGVRCKRVVEIQDRNVQPKYGGPEYETVATFGSYCGVDELDDICLANQLCNMYGLDTISAGATIAFAMECYENNLIDDELTEGLKLNFGNGKVFEQLIPQIAKKSSKLGILLAEGSARAAKIIGNGADKFFMGVKKQEFPAHMPQFKPAVGIIYAVNPFGADHQSSEHDHALTFPEHSECRERLAMLGISKVYEDQFSLDDEKVRFAFESQCYFSLLDTLCLCQFVWGPSWELYGPLELIEICKSAIGWNTTMVELLKVGERRINMMRWFNSKNGFTKKDDILPDRIFKPMKEGPFKDKVLDKQLFEQSLEQYYQFAGWDTLTGNPTESNLRRLSLQWLIELN